MPEITVYTTPGCVQCAPTKRKLAKAGVPFVEIDLSLPKYEATAARLRSMGYAQAPVVMTSYGDEWTGFRPDLLDLFIERYREASNA